MDQTLKIVLRQKRAPVLDKLRDDSHHMLVRKEFKQLSGQATVPDSVISRCQIYKHGTNLSKAGYDVSEKWRSTGIGFAPPLIQHL